MEHLDEQEMLIQYSEMAAFDFNSEEFKRIREDYVECRNFVTGFLEHVCRIFDKEKTVKSW